MYIQKIRIEGLRNFHDTTIEFDEGINVIIGHNNAGKINALKALSLVLDSETSKKLEIDDSNKAIAFKTLQDCWTVNFPTENVKRHLDGQTLSI